MNCSTKAHNSQSLFLDAFGRPDPNQDPPCERTGDTTVVQALHLMNAKQLSRKLEEETGRVARLAKSDKSVSEIGEELYLLVYSRFPTESEARTAAEYFTKGLDLENRTQDVYWWCKAFLEKLDRDPDWPAKLKTRP